jgi:hypothetical protein
MRPLASRGPRLGLAVGLPACCGAAGAGAGPAAGPCASWLPGAAANWGADESAVEPAGHLEGAASAAAAAAGAAGAAGATGATGAGATAARPAPAAARCSLRPCGPQSASAGQPSSAARFLGLLLLLPLPPAHRLHRPLLPAAGRVAWGGGEAAASAGSWPHTGSGGPPGAVASAAASSGGPAAVWLGQATGVLAGWLLLHGPARCGAAATGGRMANL